MLCAHWRTPLSFSGLPRRFRYSLALCCCSVAPPASRLCSFSSARALTSYGDFKISAWIYYCHMSPRITTHVGFASFGPQIHRNPPSIHPRLCLHFLAFVSLSVLCGLCSGYHVASNKSLQPTASRRVTSFSDD